MNKKLYFIIALIGALLAFKTHTFFIYAFAVLITQVGLGTLLAFLIDILTIGYGKDVAGWIAHKRGYQSCGCDEREALLNKYTKINIIQNIKL